MRKKNGKIECMRFIFSIMVILFHCNRIFIGDIPNKGYEPGLMPRGYIAVEFFFMVSGFLMAKSVVKSNVVSSGQHLGKGYIKFMWGKVSSLLPYHMVAVICMLIMDIITKQNSLKEEFLLFLDYIPSILFLQKTGIQFKNLNGVEWYISGMLLAMALIYPLCKKFYSTYSKIVAPIIVILIYGWIFHDYHTLTGVSKWDFYGYRCVWRAIAGINLGIFAHECSNFIAKEKWSRSEVRKWTVLELICFALVLGFSLVSAPKKYEIYAVFLIFVLVVLVFSGITLGEKYFDNKVVYFLGKLSLPLYLMQLVVLYTVDRMLTGYPVYVQVIISLIAIPILALVCMLVGDKWMSSLKKSHFNQMLARD